MLDLASPFSGSRPRTRVHANGRGHRAKQSKIPKRSTGTYGRRYYSPSQGRFLGRDPKSEVGGINLYAFCRNDGLNLWDAFGMEPDFDPSYLGQTETVLEMIGGRFQYITYVAVWNTITQEGDEGLQWEVASDLMGFSRSGGFSVAIGTGRSSSPATVSYNLHKLIKKFPWQIPSEALGIYDFAAVAKGRAASGADMRKDLEFLLDGALTPNIRGVSNESQAIGALHDFQDQQYILLSSHGGPSGPGFSANQLALTNDFYEAVANAFSTTGPRTLILTGCNIASGNETLRDFKMWIERAQKYNITIAMGDFDGPSGGSAVVVQPKDGSWFSVRPDGTVIRYANDGSDPIALTGP